MHSLPANQVAGAWVILEAVLVLPSSTKAADLISVLAENVGKLYRVLGEPLIMGTLSFRPSGEIIKLLNGFNIYAPGFLAALEMTRLANQGYRSGSLKNVGFLYKPCDRYFLTN